MWPRNNDTGRGLTTAATVWLSAAIGMACGAGMIPLAATAVALDYIVVLFLGPLTSRLQRRRGEVTVRIDYEIGRAIMPEILQVATASGFTATLEETEVTRATASTASSASRGAGSTEPAPPTPGRG